MKRPLLVPTAWVAALAVASAQSPLSQAPPPVSHPQSALPVILTGIGFDEDQPAKSVCLIRCGGQPERAGLFSAG